MYSRDYSGFQTKIRKDQKSWAAGMGGIAASASTRGRDVFSASTKSWGSSLQLSALTFDKTFDFCRSGVKKPNQTQRNETKVCMSDASCPATVTVIVLFNLSFRNFF